MVLIVAGLATMAFSIIWPRMAPPSDRWSKEQAAALEEAEDQFRQAFATPPEERQPGDLDNAEQRYRALLSSRQEALGSRVRIALVLQMLGVGTGLIGSVWLILRQDEAPNRPPDQA